MQKKFFETLGIEEISKLILRYFLKILTNENPIIDVEATPGISTLSVF